MPRIERGYDAELCPASSLLRIAAVLKIDLSTVRDTAFTALGYFPEDASVLPSLDVARIVGGCHRQAKDDDVDLHIQPEELPLENWGRYRMAV